MSNSYFEGLLETTTSVPLKIPLKGTVSVISSDPPWKDGNARFTTVHLKAYSDQLWFRYQFV